MSTSEQILQLMEAFPLHAQFGFTLDHCADGHCKAHVTVGPAHLNAGGVIHGGVMYLLLDVTSYCAAMTAIPDGTTATTHDIHVSVLRPTPPGVELVLEGRVRKAGRSVVFLDAEATVDGVLMASARVTKTILPLG